MHMNSFYLTAAIIAFFMGGAHSLMGERYFLKRLFKRELPYDVGSEVFINRTTRIAWHLTTVAWCGLALLLVVLSSNDTAPLAASIGNLIALTFLISAALSAAGSKGRHLSWIVFLLIALTTWVGVRTS